MLAYSPMSSSSIKRMSIKESDVSLVSFFIFNSTFAPREDEEEKKIIYYYPADVDLDKQIRSVGLCEAVLRFSSTFTDKDTETIHTQKTRKLLFQAEQDYWMVMNLNIPFTERIKEEQKVIDYHEDDVQDSVYLSVIKQSYNMFKLFNGNIRNIMKKGGVPMLKQKFSHFFNNYLDTLKLHQSDILDVFNGLHFLPLDKNMYLKIQSFINILEATFTSIEQTAFLYNDQLVWSGLEQDDMRIMFKYLTNALLPAQLEQELTESLTIAGSKSKHFGRYILGPPDLNNEKKLGKIPQVYVETENGHTSCHLLVYRALSATICILVEGRTNMNYKFLKELDSFLGPKTSKIASEISEQYSKKTLTPIEAQFKYVYFNHMNLAQKTTVHLDSTKTANIPSNILKLLADLSKDLKTSTKVDEGETMLKTASDCWIVGKKSDQREFYVVLNQKNANLSDINEEVKKLCSLHFNNIFFLD